MRNNSKVMCKKDGIASPIVTRKRILPNSARMILTSANYYPSSILHEGS